MQGVNLLEPLIKLSLVHIGAQVDFKARMQFLVHIIDEVLQVLQAVDGLAGTGSVTEQTAGFLLHRAYVLAAFFR